MRQVSLRAWKNWLTLQRNVRLQIFYIIRHLSTEYWSLYELNRIQTKETPLAVYCAVHIKTTFIHTHTHTHTHTKKLYIYRATEGNQFWSFTLHSFHQLNIPFISSCPNNFLPAPSSPNPITWQSPNTLVLKARMLHHRCRDGFPDNATCSWR